MIDDSTYGSRRNGEIDEAREEELIARFGEALSPLIQRFGYEGIDTIGLLTARLTQMGPPGGPGPMERGSSLLRVFSLTEKNGFCKFLISPIR